MRFGGTLERLHFALHQLTIPVEISFKKSTSLGNKKSFDIVKKQVCFQVPVFVGVRRLIL